MEKSTLIIITGPECSGKTTLLRSLCASTVATGIEEYARIYLRDLNRPYRPEDLMHIAREQVRLIFQGLGTGDTPVISDTGPEVVEIWYKEKFGSVPAELSRLNELLPECHYLLCSPDLAWEEDPLRENPHDRDRLFQQYLEWLKCTGASYTIIGGTNRLTSALEAVENWRKNKMKHL